MDSSQRIPLFILVLGTMMGALDSTIVILAFPSISASLHSDLVVTLWVIIIYLLVIAVTTTQLGRIGDIWGRSRMFNAGFAIFTIGSLFCGLSSTITLLIASRVVQAVGGALLEANSGAIVADSFSPNERGKAFGYISLGWTSGAMLGIVLGGVITTFVGWEFIFFINVPIGIAATILGVYYVRDTARTPAGLDLAGMVVLGTALMLLSYSAVDFVSIGAAPSNLLFACAGVFVALVFFLHERRTPHPLLETGILKGDILRYSIVAAFFQSLGYLSVVFMITMYLQGIRGLSPLNAALLLTPGYLVGSLLSPFMGAYSDRYGARAIATTGLLVLMGATGLYLLLGVHTSLTFFLVVSAVSGIGTSMFYPANSSAVMAHARAYSYGATSGVLRTVQNIGVLGSFVVAITIASATIPRDVAFEVFIGTTNLIGGVSESFLAGIDAALVVSIVIMAIACAFSWARGKDIRLPGAPG
jgi:EmrB/QacA subfamily drug resistance transporter